MDGSDHTTAGISTSTSSSSSAVTSVKWQLRSTVRRQRIRRETIRTEPSLRCVSRETPRRSRSAPGTVERTTESDQPALPVLPRDGLVTVKFALPTGGVLTRAFPGLTSIGDVKDVLGPLVGANTAELELLATSTETTADDADVLADLGVGNFGVLSLRITAPPDARLRRDAGDILTAPPPDVLTVLVRGAKEKRPREVVVEVQRAGGASAKPFLGGLRNVCTGAIFHHAATQTDRRQPTRTTARFSRDTQAGLRCTRATATIVERTVQTGVPPQVSEGFVILEGNPQRFEADQAKRFRSACILQRCLRTWLVKRRRQQLEAQKEAAAPIFQLEEEPSDYDTREPDIESLLNAVHEWRCAEEDRLKKITAVLTQRAERLDVLAEEARRLAQVDALRVQRRDARRRRRLEGALRKAARPKTWRGSTGRRLEADTPTTLRYRRILELYETTMKSWRNSPEALRETADALEPLLIGISTPEDISRLQSLIIRRATYLERGTATEGSVLLERVRDLFLEIPQANQPSQSPPPVANCRSCGKPLPSQKFALHTRLRAMRRCANCSRMSMREQDRATDAKLKRLTEMMRRNELQTSEALKVPPGDQPAFLLQPDDIRMLATRVWPGRSVLAGVADLERLRLGRWQRWKPFSPWNCVLLTQSELSAHLAATAACGPEMVYSPSFVARIRRRHLQASLRFRSNSLRRGSSLDKIHEVDDSEVNEHDFKNNNST